ncbi:hypothetical protein QAD02_000777 [Eretmocerus hayati]|uniref:Uncharacterized protein n=1 Tax=Eretmocerus hayati TaxID=131215 RepID=A0ACC2NED4_9HYME|nr:hypothetical protein QAD02_000777 [Eretmocerus hayati]
MAPSPVNKYELLRGKNIARWQAQLEEYRKSVALCVDEHTELENQLKELRKANRKSRPRQQASPLVREYHLRSRAFQKSYYEGGPSGKILQDRVASPIVCPEDRRRKWTNEQHENFKAAFKSFLNRCKYPSFDEIRSAQSQYPALLTKTLPQIKTHCSNYFQKQSKQSLRERFKKRKQCKKRKQSKKGKMVSLKL